MQKYTNSPHTQTPTATEAKRGRSVQKILFASLCLGFLFLLAIPVSGQGIQPSTNEKIHFGLLIGGACNTTFPMDGPWTFTPASTKIGVSGGAYFQFDFAKRFFAHLELNISSRRLLATGNSMDTAYGNFDLSYHYTHISVPLGIGYSFFPHTNPFNASLIASAVIGLPQENKSEISVHNQDVTKKIYPIGIGAMLELRLRYRFVFLGFRYEFSGTDLFKYHGQSFKTGTFSFLLGFQIF